MKMMNHIQKKMKNFSNDNQNFLIDFYIENKKQKKQKMKII
jgi:hypothetical protein